jgi:hypothetical protein
MQTSDKSRFPLIEAYSFAEARGLGEEVERIRSRRTRFKSYNSTVRRGYIIELFEHEGILHDFLNQIWPLGRTPEGAKEIECCRKVMHDFEASHARS